MLCMASPKAPDQVIPVNPMQCLSKAYIFTTLFENLRHIICIRYSEDRARKVLPPYNCSGSSWPLPRNRLGNLRYGRAHTKYTRVPIWKINRAKLFLQWLDPTKIHDSQLTPFAYCKAWIIKPDVLFSHHRHVCTHTPSKCQVSSRQVDVHTPFYSSRPIPRLALGWCDVDTAAIAASWSLLSKRT